MGLEGRKGFVGVCRGVGVGGKNRIWVIGREGGRVDDGGVVCRGEVGDGSVEVIREEGGNVGGEVWR